MENLNEADVDRIEEMVETVFALAGKPCWEDQPNGDTRFTDAAQELFIFGVDCEDMDGVPLEDERDLMWRVLETTDSRLCGRGAASGDDCDDAKRVVELCEAWAKVG